MRDGTLRSLEEIDAALAATEARLRQLKDERAEIVAGERSEIVKAFDDGARRAQIVAAFGITYRALACILNRAGRSEKQRRAVGLSLKQAVEYRRLLLAGVPSRAARNIAMTLAGSEGQAVDLQGARP
jgi:hypothetical protein